MLVFNVSYNSTMNSGTKKVIIFTSSNIIMVNLAFYARFRNVFV